MIKRRQLADVFAGCFLFAGAISAISIIKIQNSIEILGQKFMHRKCFFNDLFLELNPLKTSEIITRL